MSSIHLNDHLDRLRKLAESYDLPLEGVMTVPSILEWCKNNGADEDNPQRAAKVVRNRDTGRFLVLLAETLEMDYVRGSLIPVMELQGLYTEAQKLKDASTFVKHLLLHELAHIIDDSWTEEHCNRWAFAEIEKMHPNKEL